jgi:membrane protein DedA with SNARE-associated domain|tara:strand:+ start:7102 stop:7317 length:216 start_codon:yes stop_codon:yes gene_type:complete
MSQEKKTNDNPLKALAKVSGMGIRMGLTIYGGNLLGSWLDQKTQLNFLEISLTLLAIALAIYAMIKQAKIQ